MPRFRNVNGTRIQLTQAEENVIDAEELYWETNIKPGEVVEETFKRVTQTAGMQFSDVEKMVMSNLYHETQRVRLGIEAGVALGDIRTPMIDAIVAANIFPGQTKQDIGVAIESRVESYMTTAATALAQKIKDGG